jgi:hypothetical protein
MRWCELDAALVAIGRWCELDAALVAIGRVDAGIALPDEAIAGGGGREGDDLDTVVLVSAARGILGSRR